MLPISDIAEKVMLAMAKTGFPALPVHDSFIIRMGMGVDLESAMKRAFKEVTGAPAKIKPDHSSVGLVHAKRGKAWERRVELAKKKGFNPGLVSGKEEDFAYMDEYDAEYSRYLERYRESLKTGWSKMFPVKKVKKKAR